MIGPSRDPAGLLAEFAAEHQRGGPADPREFLRQVPASDRPQLAALIDAYLARAPRQPVREPLEASSQAQTIVDALGRELWP